MMNMSYCRFENTLEALRECYQDLGERMNLDGLSESEAKAARKLFRLCEKIAQDWELEIPRREPAEK